MTDKPRIRLHVWYDCGHRYEHWRCTGFSPSKIVRTGIGSTPKLAYQDWLNRLVGLPWF